jgi:predicted O-methyltransferase YrrM
MIQSLQNPKVVQFIQENLHVQPTDLILGAHKYPELPIKEIAGQIESRQQIQKKLPKWYANPKLLFPKKSNLEQASSELTAEYKANLVQGKSVIDLTGGSGVDTYAFSQAFEQVDYVEPNVELCALARHNFKVLSANVNVIESTAEEFLLKNQKSYDLIYIDPSRRNAKNQRLIALEDYEPNVIALNDALAEISDKILIKASPMLDIQKALGQLHNVSKVFCVSVDNEMKEVLFLIDHQHKAEEVNIICHNLGNPKAATFTFSMDEEDHASSEFSEPKSYIYDPYTCIKKGGGFKLFGKRFRLGKLSTNTHLYTSSEFIEQVPARVFKVIKHISSDSKSIKKVSDNGAINVISKNHPLNANQIKKKYRLKDGGNQFLIFCSDQVQKHILLCEMLTS